MAIGNNGQINFNTDRLMDLNYNPLLANANQHLTLSNDADPDFYFYCDLNFSCDYLNEEQFNTIANNSRSELFRSIFSFSFKYT